jgi:hypothetical protein
MRSRSRPFEPSVFIVYSIMARRAPVFGFWRDSLALCEIPAVADNPRYRGICAKRIADQQGDFLDGNTGAPSVSRQLRRFEERRLADNALRLVRAAASLRETS